MGIVQCQKEKYYLLFRAKESNNRNFVQRIINVFPTFVGPQVKRHTVYLKANEHKAKISVSWEKSSYILYEP